MNRYYITAIILAIIAILSIAGIWIVDVSDENLQQRIDFTFKAVGAIGTVLTIISYFIGKSKNKPQETIRQDFDSIPDTELLSRRESIDQYLSNLEARLNEFGVKRTRFVELSTEVDASSLDDDIKLLQSFEWAERNWVGESFITKRKPINFMQVHETFQRYVLLGDPGSGKTTCLQVLAMDLIEKYKVGASEMLPFLVSLSEWRDRRMSALEFIRFSFTRLAGSGNCLVKEFDNLLAQGKLLVILDGLNEMPDRYYHQETEEERKVRTHVNILMKLSSADTFRSMQDARERSLRELAVSRAIRTHFIVSCRTHEFFGSPDWQEVHVLPMDASQIREFLQKYMGVNKVGELENMLEKNATLGTLAQNPFFLQCMIGAFSPELSFVQNKGQFLEYLTRKLLEREKNRGMIFEPDRIIRTASKLAFGMLRRNLIGSQIELASLGRKYYPALNVLLGTGLVIARGEGNVSFYHQLIQEFFAAIALRDKNVKLGMNRLLREKKWSEVIILWHDINDEASLFPRLLKGLSQRNGFRSKFWVGDAWLLMFYVFLATNLLIDIVFKGNFVLPIITQNPLETIVVLLVLPLMIRSVWLYSTFDRIAITNAAYILGNIRNPIAIDHLIETFSRLQGGQEHTETAKALARFDDNAIPNLILGLSSVNHRIQAGCIEALGLIKAVQAVPQLLAILNGKDASLTYQTITALSNIDDPRAELAIAKTIYRSPEGCAQGFGRTNLAIKFRNFSEFDQGIFNTLEEGAQKSQSQSCRYMAIQAIGYYGYAQGLPVLEKIAVDTQDDLAMRNSAIYNISQLETAEAVSVLFNIFANFSDLSRAASSSIGCIRCQDAVNQLVSLLDHSEAMLREAVVVALSEIGTWDTLPDLIGRLNDESKEVREQLPKAFGRIGGDQALDGLDILCRDSESSVRISALESLDFFFPAHAKEMFITLAKDRSYPDRGKAIESLAYYRYPEVKNTLLELCADTDDDVKYQAIESLQRLDQSLSQELRHVYILRRKIGLRRKVISFLKQKLHTDEYQMLLRDAKMGGRQQELAGSVVLSRIAEDSELKRKFRIWFILIFALLFLSCVLLPGIAAAAGVRIVRFLGVLLWNGSGKWICLSIIVISIISYLPQIRKAQKITLIGYLYTTVRFLAISVLIVFVSAAIFSRWWLILLTVIIGAISYKVLRKLFPKFSFKLFDKMIADILRTNEMSQVRQNDDEGNL
jgi:HEAT repeat protein